MSEPTVSKKISKAEINDLPLIQWEGEIRILNTIEEMSLRDGYRYEQDMTLHLGKSADAREAMLAFRDKRPPVFTGR